MLSQMDFSWFKTKTKAKATTSGVINEILPLHYSPPPLHQHHLSSMPSALTTSASASARATAGGAAFFCFAVELVVYLISCSKPSTTENKNLLCSSINLDGNAALYGDGS